jgi:copper chaperone CopZ
MRNEALNTLALVALVIAGAVGGPWLWQQVRSLPGHRALAARSGEHVVTLEVGGMTCAGCASKVRTELASVDGVSAVEVRLQQDKAVVVCRPGVEDSTLLSAVRRAGPGFAAFVATP